MAKKTKIKTFEEACEKLKRDPKALPDVSMMPENHQKAITAHCKLIIIAEALNEGWQPNWNNSSEWKYYPWFWVQADKDTPSGSGLSCYGCGYSSSHSYVGSRLCFKTEALAEYAGKQFKELYEDLFLIK